MKDTVLTGHRKKTEIITFIICFVIANLVNLYSIITYNTKFIELITSLGYVFVLAVALYAFWTLLRLLYFGVRKVMRTRKIA